MACGLSQAPCTLQLAATALLIDLCCTHSSCVTGCLLGGCRDRGSEQALPGERSLTGAKQKLNPLGTILVQVDLLEHSKQICKTHTRIPGFVPLHKSNLGPLRLRKPSMGEAWELSMVLGWGWLPLTPQLRQFNQAIGDHPPA